MNSLKDKYGLGDALGPIEKFWTDPSLRSLRSVPKELQTTEMISAVINGDEVPTGSILRHVSARALTDDLRKRALEIDGADLKYVSKRHMSPELARIAVSNCWWALRWVPEDMVDDDICSAAVNLDGRALKYVPEELRNYELCLAAVMNDHGTDENHAIREVPFEVLLGRKGEDLCKAAVKANGLAIMGVPEKYVNSDLAQTAIENDPRGWQSSVIRFIPKSLINKQLVDLACKVNPSSLADMPSYAMKYVTRSTCIRMLERNPECIRYLPEKFLSSKKVIEFALEQSPTALRYIPEKARTKSRCFSAKERDPEGVSLSWFPEKTRLQWESMHAEAKAASLHQEPFSLCVDTKELTLSRDTPNDMIEITDLGRLAVHHFDDEPASPKAICYISDIHLEHQLPFDRCSTVSDAKQLIREKVEELLNSLPEGRPIVLIGGDIANSVDLETMFYEALAEESDERRLGLTVLSVLGNHELWDVGNEGRNIEEIFADYKNHLKSAFESSVYANGTILENALYLVHKGRRARVIREEDILQCNPAELRELCEESSLVILGGLGYSGLNPEFNANMGLYRSALSYEEDLARARRFEAVHNRLAQCADRKRVIVLTHTPVHDWLAGSPSRNWIYINGHTHRNGMRIEDQGPSILFDNQIGYDPKIWHFNLIEMEGRYDPFEKWGDGIYEITASQYRDFNRGRGIDSTFNRMGTPYVVKHHGLYMFFLEKNGRTYMLEGGRISTVDHPMSWYFDNIPLYAERVRSAFAPYHHVLQKISEEVRSFGGYGFAHGCIVDINFFNHIYLNPYDGTITPYFAFDMTDKRIYDTVEHLLIEGTQTFRTPELRRMLESYTMQDKSGKLSLLSSKNTLAKKDNLVALPETYTDRSMYFPSKIMRSVQYLFDDDVIRIWRDSVLKGDDKMGSIPIGASANEEIGRKGLPSDPRA